MSRWLMAVVLVAMPVGASAATLAVKVEDIDSKGGILRLSLYDEAGWSKAEDAPLMSANVPAVAPETVVVLKDVKPGVYGIKTFQDANSNGRFDQGFLGIPLERYGFSRDARPFLSEPGFNRAKITVGEGENEITIHLQ
ncbi:MAG: DUF2141 domain-containing protein [Alphaproteobacteria bacterium]|nr:DUF2141 domain-containing protein [Alphaproteobacteria bacterium]